MSETEGLVSVIMPVYNGERFLAEAIESVLAQGHRPLEAIVVDDGSTDSTAQVASRFPEGVRYVYQPNSGPPAARNRGLKMAQGSFIGFLDADDLWTEGKLELQLALLDGNPSVEVVIGLKQIVRIVGLQGGRHQSEKLSEADVNLNLGTSLFRRSAFETVGFFDEALQHCDDWDWYMRARETGVSMARHQDVTLIYRRHEDNITNRVEVGHHYALKMLKKSLDRRKVFPSVTSLPKLEDIEDKPSG
jgi:glycosyltransferase involved in cell wall biosynthesis